MWDWHQQDGTKPHLLHFKRDIWTFLKATVQPLSPGTGLYHCSVDTTALLSGKTRGHSSQERSPAPGAKRALPRRAGKTRRPLPCKSPTSAEDATEAEQVSPKQRELSKHPLRQ